VPFDVDNLQVPRQGAYLGVMADFVGERTEHAQRGAALTLVFEMVLSKRVPGYKVELAAPEESTGGGVRTMQRIRLVPKVPKADVTVVVVGEADVDKGVAELRTLGHVQAIHERRFARPFPIPKADYLSFLENAEKVLKEFGLKVSLNAVPDLPPVAVPPPTSVSRSFLTPALLIVGCVAGAAAIGWAYLH
jgi:hypothetical protein